MIDASESVRELQVPSALSAVLHWSESVNDRIGELSRRLECVLRNEPVPTDKAESMAKSRINNGVSLAINLNEVASRCQTATERVEDLLRRLEL